MQEYEAKTAEIPPLTQKAKRILKVLPYATFRCLGCGDRVSFAWACPEGVCPDCHAEICLAN